MAADINTYIGDKVRHARIDRGYTLQQLAEKIPSKPSFQMLAQYEKGTSRWPADLLNETAKVLRHNINHFLGNL